ncbi:hypothetical protein MNBD_GAMMA09-1149 [hydrothermal vent metagenome]|uniref:Uncharacterized protein n=1 Tax=hydrothermal vent metagenome TaxID=652676 RepID=A0A3B0X6H8_9ZZZZ
MKEQVEYATLYSKQERIRLGLALASGLLALLLAGYYILYPEWQAFMLTVHCETILGIPGMAALAYGVFVGIPVVCGIVVEIMYAWTAIKTITEKRFPPLKAKVFKKTKVVYGREALIKGVFMLLVVPALLVPVVSWGYLQAGDFIRHINVDTLDYSICVKRINNF